MDEEILGEIPGEPRLIDTGDAGVEAPGEETENDESGDIKSVHDVTPAKEQKEGDKSSGWKPPEVDYASLISERRKQIPPGEGKPNKLTAEELEKIGRVTRKHLNMDVASILKAFKAGTNSWELLGYLTELKKAGLLSREDVMRLFSLGKEGNKS